MVVAMGLSKQYLKYLPHTQFGVIATARCNVLFLSLRYSKTRYVAAGSCEHVNVWDVKTGLKVMVLRGDKYSATVLAKSPDGQYLAVGYSDGSIKIFSLVTSEVIVTYSGHTARVTSLTYDGDGMKLASGSQDARVIVWDLVSESGRCKLKGHKDQITCCRFIKKNTTLVTSSKDTFIKWWDLDTQHCFKTMVGHRAEVWCFLMTPDDNVLISGSGGSALRVWALDFNTDEAHSETKKTKMEDGNMHDYETLYSFRVVATKLGSVIRQENDRVVSLCMSPDAHLIACHGTGMNIELFKVRTDAEIETHLKKKVKKLKRKVGASGKNELMSNSMLDEGKKHCSDMFVHVGKFKMPGKIKSVDVSRDDDGYKIACLLQDNQIIIKAASMKSQFSDLSLVGKLSTDGHRTACRSLSFTSDGLELLTISANSAKMWNRISQQCIQTHGCNNATSCIFAPGDKQFLVGTTGGGLEIHDIPSGMCTERICSHSDSITSLALYSNKRGLITGSKDKSVKFWDFDLISDEKFTSCIKRLSVTHSRTLQLGEEVKVVEFSQNGKLLACALFNCSVKLFYVDTLKFFLSLYGHSLPVTCMSISSDCSLIATGSSDRNIKFWGLDFGDCHRSVFAHDDSITSIKFVPDTHLLFSAGKDGCIKQWDANKFIHIQTLQGSQEAVLCLAIDHDGGFLASCGSDLALRFWMQSSEIVVPDEEHEKEREEEDGKRLVAFMTTTAEEDEAKDSTRVNKPTIEVVKGAENIMKAVQLNLEKHAKLAQKEVKFDIQPHPLLKSYGNISSEQYVLEVLRKVKSADLQNALLVLPFYYVPELLDSLNNFISGGWNIELSCRCLLFLLKIHRRLISFSGQLLPVLENLQQSTEKEVQELQSTMGFNLTFLRHLKREIEAKNGITFFDDATDRFYQKKLARKDLEQAFMTM